MPKRYVYRVGYDHNYGSAPFVERLVVLKGPDEEGRYLTKGSHRGEWPIHVDWLSPSPEEAITAEETRERRNHERKMAALAALRMKAKP